MSFPFCACIMHAQQGNTIKTPTTSMSSLHVFSTIPHNTVQHVSPEIHIIAILGFWVPCQTEQCWQYSQTSLNLVAVSNIPRHHSILMWLIDVNKIQYVYKYQDYSSKEGVVVSCRADIVWSQSEYVLNDVNQMWNISKYQNNSNKETFADLMSIKFDIYLNVRTTRVKKLLCRADIVWSRAAYADLIMSINSKYI